MRLEALHLSLPSSDRKMAIFDLVVVSQSPGLVVIHTSQNLHHSRVRTQSVRNNAFRHAALVLGQFLQQFQSSALLRRCYTRTSRTSPSLSTARHIYIRWPFIRTTISSRCHTGSARPRRRQMLAAMAGPTWLAQHRSVSYVTSIPRSASRSSTSRRLSVKR